MNPSATAAAPRAAHDALDASPRVPTTYLPSAEYLRAQDYLPTVLLLQLQLPTTYLLQWRRTPSAFLLQNSGKTAAASQRRTPRAFARGGTLVVHVAMSATCLQIGIIRLVNLPISGHSLAALDTPYSGEINGIFH